MKTYSFDTNELLMLINKFNRQSFPEFTLEEVEKLADEVARGDYE